MLVDIAKRTAVKRILTCFSKRCAVEKKISFPPPFRYFSYNLKSSRMLCEKITISQDYTIKSYFSTEINERSLDKVTFESVCGETLESLTEYFEELVESLPQFKNGDVTYSDGVLTVNLGNNFGTYVINRQTPNLQIWLSSPKSGPKRYDFVDGTWVYKHDKTTLHALLEKEIQEIAQQEVEFIKNCSHAKASV